MEFEENFRNDLYFSKSTIERMDNGQLGNGYIAIPEEQKPYYELVPRAAFNPVVKISENEYQTCWIFK